MRVFRIRRLFCREKMDDVKSMFIISLVSGVKEEKSWKNISMKGNWNE